MSADLREGWNSWRCLSVIANIDSGRLGWRNPVTWKGGMTYDLTRFDLGAMLKCSLQLREVSNGNPTLESAAQRVCRFLYDELRTPEGARACALVRCYKTHPFADLSP